MYVFSEGRTGRGLGATRWRRTKSWRRFGQSGTSSSRRALGVEDLRLGAQRGSARRRGPSRRRWAWHQPTPRTGPGTWPAAREATRPWRRGVDSAAAELQRRVRSGEGRKKGNCSAGCQVERMRERVRKLTSEEGRGKSRSEDKVRWKDYVRRQSCSSYVVPYVAHTQATEPLLTRQFAL